MSGTLTETPLCAEAMLKRLERLLLSIFTLCSQVGFAKISFFQEEADLGRRNNKQTSPSIISLMKNGDFPRAAPWVFLVALGPDVRIGGFGSAWKLALALVCVTRMSQERADIKAFCFDI